MTTNSPILDITDVYQPHVGQAVLHESKAKVKVVWAGRRWGKSRGAFGELLFAFIDSLSIPVSKSLVPPFHAWIVVPALPQGRQVWSELMQFLVTDLKPLVHSHQQEEKTIYLKGSEGRPWGLIELKSAHDPESLQTVGLDFLWVSEAQDVKMDAFQKLQPTLRSPERMGRAIFEGIPPLWRDHWFRLNYDAAERGRNGYEAFRFTAFDNPYLNDEQRIEIESDREIFPEAAWNRMYMAEYSDSAGYFRNIDACVAGDLLPEPIAGSNYVAGLDLGRKRDATVLIIMDAVQRRVVECITYDQGQNWVLQREGIMAAIQRWGIHRVLVDSTGMGGDIFFQEMQEEGAPLEEYIFNQASREHLLNVIGVSLERETVHFPPIVSMLRELRAMQLYKTSGGRVRVDHPSGEHDDHVFALALALEVCEPAHGLVSGNTVLRSRRYAPTQAEAEGRSIMNGIGPRVMRERLQKRMEERWQRTGVQL